MDMSFGASADSIGAMEGIIAIIAIIGIFFVPIIAVVSVLIYLLKKRSRERMELIRQGIVPSAQTKANPNRLTTLRNGCLLIGLSLGIIIGLVVDGLLSYIGIASFLIIASSISLFMGVGYVVFYLIVKGKDQDEE